LAGKITASQVQYQPRTGTLSGFCHILISDKTGRLPVVWVDVNWQEMKAHAAIFSEKSGVIPPLNMWARNNSV